MKAHSEFVNEMKLIDNRLDCVFNILEKCWMIVLWENPAEWHWVMTLRDRESGARYLPCGFALDRLKELKWKWEERKIQEEIEKAEKQAADKKESDLEDMAMETAKMLRKPLLNDMDGVTSSWNVFL